ncbi:amidohydrolase family protein [Maribacter sp. 2307UL18-2]|uniref:amidohydrolase family protein n=1 Tax=Maribacter sp. 2307UL18-2 TaxID=3386274 RepID=UPI0039BD76D7
MKISKCILSIVFLTFTAGCSNYYTKQLVKENKSALPILIKNVHIFNGKDSSLVLNKDVLVENGFIERITEHSKTKNDQTYHIIDGNGKTLMPGLIDAHVHLSGSGAVPWENVSADETYNLKAYLHSGITTVFDLGGMASDIEKLSQEVGKGELLGPTIYHSHIPITVKNGHPIPLTKEILGWPLRSFINMLAPTIEKADDAEKVIQEYLEENVDYVKIIYDRIPPDSPVMSYDVLQALIDQAHGKGYKVFVHIGSPQNAVDAVNAGADILAHGVWRGKLTPGQADIIASSKVPIIYTLAAFQNVNNINKGEYYPEGIDTLLVPKIILDPVTGAKGLDVESQKTMKAFFDDVTDKSQFLFDNFTLLKERNVQFILGTDSSLPGTYAGSTYLQEIDALKAYGLSNFEILSGATHLPSKLFLDNPDFGTVEVGKKADLLLINGNPLENLELIKSPETILQNGNIIVKVEK